MLQVSSSKFPESPSKSGFQEGSVRTRRARRIALADVLALLSLLGLISISIAVIVIVFMGYAQRWSKIPPAITVLQTGIATLMIPVLTAVLRLLGQRFVYARLSDKGLRSRQVANFSNWSISSVLGQIVAFRLEPLGILFLLIWLLGLATGFTVRESVKLGDLYIKDFPLAVPVGPLDSDSSLSLHDSLVSVTAGTINSLVSTIATQTEGSLGYINVTSAYNSSVYYPPLLFYPGSFSSYAELNGFDVEVSTSRSLSRFASRLNCTQAYSPRDSFWLVDATRGMLTFTVGFDDAGPYTTIKATAVRIRGQLTVERFGPNPYAELAASRGSTLLIMDDRDWVRELMDIVCNTVLIKTIYSLRNLKDFGYGVNQRDMYNTNSGVVSQQQVWTTVMGTVIGAYSINRYSSMVDSPKIYVDAVSASVFLVPTYATYILIVNTVVLVVLLLALWRLLNASPLHRDFMDPTRLLLGPLADVQLFNASLDETIRKLDNPHLQVTPSQQLLLTGSKDGDNPPPLSVQ